MFRNGTIETIPSLEVVPGDIVQVKMDDTIPADLRLFYSMNMEYDEKTLNGEAIPAATNANSEYSDKDVQSIGIADRLNIGSAHVPLCLRN